MELLVVALSAWLEVVLAPALKNWVVAAFNIAFGQLQRSEGTPKLAHVKLLPDGGDGLLNLLRKRRVRDLDILVDDFDELGLDVFKQLNGDLASFLHPFLPRQNRSGKSNNLVEVLDSNKVAHCSGDINLCHV